MLAPAGRAAALVACLSCSPAFAAPAPTKKAVERWGAAQILFVGTLSQVTAGPVARSYPPIHSHRLTFRVDSILRGHLRKGEEVRVSHALRGHAAPKFPEGKACVVSAERGRSGLRAKDVAPATDANLSDARAVAAIPLGWRVDTDGLVSPWAALGDKAWSPESIHGGKLATCSRSGRPAFLAGEGVELSVKPVPPKRRIKWTNPDGDGEYRIAVRNTTDRPVSVPALLSGGGKLLWAESIVILCQGKVYCAPGARGVSGRVARAELKAGESASCVVNVLALDGPEWPRGGYRIEFQFCLGEKSEVQSLYYMSRHHDKLRKAAHRSE